MARLSTVVVKALFAMSCNRCAFPGCDQRLADPTWKGVRADVAHISGEKPGAPRYDPTMSDAERNGIDNLLLLCPNHHREVDRLQPQEWPTERLMELKADHERRCAGVEWDTDAHLDYYAELAVQMADEQAPPAPQAPPPQLAIEKGPGQTYEVVNVGTVDAFQVDVEVLSSPGPSSAQIIEQGPFSRLSPRARWKCLIYSASLGSRGSPVVLVRWTDADGSPYEGQVPLS